MGKYLVAYLALYSICFIILQGPLLLQKSLALPYELKGKISHTLVPTVETCIKLLFVWVGFGQM